VRRPLLVGAGLLLALTAPLLGGCDQGHPVAAPAPTPVRVETVHLQTGDEVSQYAAVIRPRFESDLGFRVGGKLLARLVDVGARVEPGQPLARLDPIDLNLRVRSAEAQLAAARAEVAQTRADFQRAVQLRRDDWSTQQDYDRRKLAAETAEAKVAAQEAELRLAQNNAGYAVLTSDQSGVVTAVLAEVGQVVAQGQAVFRVARLGELEAVANIPEQRVGTLTQSSMSVELWSRPGEAIAGRLRELAPAADASTRTFQARITLPQPPPGIQLGMTATLTTRHARSGPVVLLPQSALTKQGSEPAVWVLAGAGDRLELRPVTVATYLGSQVAVAGGLIDGEQVVTAGVHKLDAGLKVRAWTEPQR